MATFELTRRAASDLEEIAEYTCDEWGPLQCERYLDELESCLERLAEAPELGRACKDLPGEYRRFEVSSHVVFYRALEGGIRVVRILHQRMLPERHLGEDDPSEQ